MWSSGGEDTETTARLAESLSNDALLRQRKAICFAMGNLKTTALFGSRGKPTSGHSLSPRRSPESLGLLGMTFNNILKVLPENAVCTLSLLEIADEETLRDMLSIDPIDSQSKLRIRHLDHRGAVIQNLADTPIDSLTGLEFLLRKAFYSQTALRIRKREGPRGHIVCTMKIWQNAVQRDLDHTTKCVTLQFVDLCSGHEVSGMHPTVLKRMASARKSLSNLRGILRRLILQDISGENYSISYRESTLMKVLQRCLSEEGVQAVVLASVSAQVQTYEHTLHTLDFVNRLFVRPGKTAQSPYDRHTPDSNKASPAEQIMENFSADENLLKSVTSDPRQRLAKLLGKSPAKPRVTPIKLHLEESYQPTDYMAVDPGDVSPELNKSRLKVEKSESDLFLNVDNEVNDGFAIFHERDENDDDHHEGEPDVFQDTYRVDDIVDEYENDSRGGRTLDDEKLERIDDTLSVSPRALSGMRNLSIHERPPHYRELRLENEYLESNAKDQQHRTIPSESGYEDRVYLENFRKVDEALVDDNTLVERWMEDEILKTETDYQHDSQASTPTESSDDAIDKSVLDHFHGQEMKGTYDAGRRDDVNVAYCTPATIVPKETDTGCENNEEGTVTKTTTLRYSVSQVCDFYSPTQSPNTTKNNEMVSKAVFTEPQKRISEKSLSEKTKKSTDPVDDTSFFSEIHNLQGTVKEVKRMQNGLLESSTTSLERLQAFQEAQQRRLEEAVLGRDASERRAEATEKELSQLKAAYLKAQQHYEEECIDLKSILDNSLVERSSVEKIAEEAIASQSRTEEVLVIYKDKLTLCNQHLRKKEKEVDHLCHSYELISSELKISKTKHAELIMDHSDCKHKIAQLEAQVKNYEKEQDELRKAGTADRICIAKLVSENGQIDALNTHLESAVKESQRWKKTCDEMKRISSKEQLIGLQNLESKEAQINQLNIKILRLDEELKSSHTRIVEMDIERGQLDELLNNERLSASNERRREQDHICRLRNELESSQKARDEALVHTELENKILRARDDEVGKLQTTLDKVTNERDQAKRRLTAMKVGIDKYQADMKLQLARIIEEKGSVDALLEKASGDVKRYKDTTENLTENLELCHREKVETDIIIVSLRQEADRKEEKRLEADNEREDLVAKVGQLESKIENLKRERDDVILIQSSFHQTSPSGISRFQPLKAMESERTRARLVHHHETDESYMAESSMGTHPALRLEKRDEQHRQKGESFTLQSDTVSMDVFRAEQIRRIQAEDLTAVISARAKNGFEDRNDEIIRLKIRLSFIIDEKEIEIRTLRSRLFEMEKQQIGTTSERSRRHHSDASNFSSYGGNEYDHRFK